MDELINGVEAGFLALAGAFLVIVPALISYACFNRLRNQTLVVLVGLAVIPVVLFLMGFNSYFINWKSVGIGLVTIYSGFALGLLAGKFFPWYEKQEEKMLTSKEVAEILQIPEKTIIYWVESKFMFGIVHSNGANIPQQSLIKWLKKFSKINSLAHNDKNMHWINKTMMEKVHLIRSKKEAVV